MHRRSSPPPNKGLQLPPASWAFLGLVAFWHWNPEASARLVSAGWCS
jgi:hypothetical protein